MKKVRYILGIIICCITLFSFHYVALWEYQFEKKLVFRSQMEEMGMDTKTEILLKEVECFPVQKDKKDEVFWYYEDAYGSARSYGGKRVHEGIDIMSSVDEPGCLRIQSVSDGIVEKIGWLELGGYRIGIRSKSGMYYYYAHLDSYKEGLSEGDHVKAGEYLGDMGNTGYGKEGTKGKFVVHLHFGLYYQQNNEETSMNPFYLLKYVE